MKKITISPVKTRKVFEATVPVPNPTLRYHIEGFPVTEYVTADAIVYDDGTRVRFADVLEAAGFPEGRILCTGLEWTDYDDEQGTATFRFEVDLPDEAEPEDQGFKTGDPRDVVLEVTPEATYVARPMDNNQLAPWALVQVTWPPRAEGRPVCLVFGGASDVEGARAGALEWMNLRGQAEMLRPSAERVADAARRAGDTFWEVVGQSFPEVTTGDIDPGALMAIESAMDVAVERWLRWNHPVYLQED